MAKTKPASQGRRAAAQSQNSGTQRTEVLSSRFSILHITLPPDLICQVPSSTVVRVTVSGRAPRLQTFDFPVEAKALLYPDPQPEDQVPLFPEASSSLGDAVTFTPSTTNGNWTIELNDSCDPGTFDPPVEGQPRPRRLVVWYRYETEFDVHYLVDAAEFSIPGCQDIDDCTT